MSDHPVQHAEGHPDERQYIRVALILAVVTAAEVVVVYVSALKDFIRPILGIMMVVKFVMVAMWFMHLKFDSRLFRRLFVLGIVLALAVFAVVLWTFTFVIPDKGTVG